jgi:hypothetical protein
MPQSTDHCRIDKISQWDKDFLLKKLDKSDVSDMHTLLRRLNVSVFGRYLIYQAANFLALDSFVKIGARLAAFGLRGKTVDEVKLMIT